MLGLTCVLSPGFLGFRVVVVGETVVGTVVGGGFTGIPGCGPLVTMLPHRFMIQISFPLGKVTLMPDRSPLIPPGIW